MTAPVTVPVTVDVKSPIVAVAELYYKACVLGDLRLSPSKVEVLAKDPNYGIAPRGMGTGLSIGKATYLRIKSLDRTYLSMVMYKKSRRHQLISSCSVSSGLLDLKSGYRVFRSFSKEQPRREVPFMMNTWFLESPKLGYRQVYSNHSGTWSHFATEIFDDASERVGEQKELR